MINRIHFLVIATTMTLCFTACSASNSDLMKNDPKYGQISAIVLMPIENKTKDTRLQKRLSARVLEELRFKGYPQVEASVDDGASRVRDDSRDDGKTKQAPAQGTAAIYCTLQESKVSSVLFYSPATVSVRCELRSTRTGETIWNAQHRSTNRSFAVRNSALKIDGILESALEEVVGKIMETLPYGPMLRG